MSNSTMPLSASDDNSKSIPAASGTSLGLKALRKFCQKGDISAWQEAKLSADLFKVNEQTVFEWVNNHVATHHVLPNEATLEAQFPETAGLEIPEPVTYYVQLLENQYFYSLINQGNIDSQTILKNDPNAYEQAAQLLQKTLEQINAHKHRAGIGKIEDIPNLLLLDIPKAEWVVDQMFCRNSITLWAGPDGAAKSYLATKLAAAVANGGEFLGRKCQQGDVLYLDYENPAHEIKTRHLKMQGSESPRLRTWGTWLDQQELNSTKEETSGEELGEQTVQ